MRFASTVVALAAVCALGCGDDPGSPADAEPPPTDVGVADAGAVPRDAGPAPPMAVGPWFEDVTVAAGVDYTRTALEGYRAMSDRLGGGVCVLDVDGVAPLDLFFALRPDAPLSSKLYVARGPFDYVDEAASRGLADVGDPVGCLAFDAEGDGDDDLLVAGLGTLRLFENDGGSFVDVSSQLPVSVPPMHVFASMAAGDVDGDGDLDLLLGGFVDTGVPGLLDDCDGVVCAAQIRNYGFIPSILLARDGARYTDASATAPELALAEPTLVVAINDVDGDGRQDLYLGNDMGDTFHDRVLVRGAGGAWADDSMRLGLAYDARGHGIDTMGWSTADVDGDGRLDHTVTAFQGFSTPIFVCGDDAFCEDRGPWLNTSARASTFRWGTALSDFDLDGDPDLLEATGHVYTEAEGVAIGFTVLQFQRPSLMLNEAGATFTPVEPVAGDALADLHAGRGLAVADLDDDGRLDAVIATTEGAPAVLRNVVDTTGHWLRVVLRAPAPNSGAVGARVTVTDGLSTLVREKSIGEGFLGNFDPRLHFGLPSASPVEVTVRWPDGRTTTTVDVPVDTEVTLEAPR